MNNSEKFYDKTKRMIDLFYEPICSLDDNFEKQKRKILKEFEKRSSEDQLTDVFSWQFLIDYAFLGLNREKIENSVNVNWEHYVPENLMSQFKFLDTRPSKAPYFKEWVKVIDCKDKYLAETPEFWVKRIRNSFMHGNFTYDYDFVAKQRIKVLEGKPTSPDLKMDVLLLGLHEFIEDNFHNVYHQDYGVIDEHVNVYIASEVKVNNRKELLDILQNKLYICTRKNKSGYSYDGNNIIDNVTGKIVSRAENKKNVMDLNTKVLMSGDPLDEDMKLSKISASYIDTLVWILENKYNIYKAPKQQNKILNAIRQYFMPMKSINKLLREFNCYCGSVTLDKKEHKSVGLDMKKTMAIFNDEKENIKNAFTILRLYRFLYRLQNKGFEDIDYKDFECKKSFLVSSEEEMQKRIDKNKLSMPDKEAENKAYLDTLRNSLAHGNVNISYVIDNNKLYPLVELKDEWTNPKTGETTSVALYSPARTLDAFLELADYKEFEVEPFDFSEINIFKEEKPREK